jgi:hypothetical protein
VAYAHTVKAPAPSLSFITISSKQLKSVDVSVIKQINEGEGGGRRKKERERQGRKGTRKKR